MKKIFLNVFAILFLILFKIGSVNATVAAYVANSDSNTISVIDTISDRVFTNIPVENGPTEVIATPKGDKVYVTHRGNNIVSVIDTSSNNVITTISVGNGPDGIAVSPDGSKVYVANWGGGVSVIDTATDTVIKTVMVGNAPTAIAISVNGYKVFVRDETGISIIDTFSDSMTGNVSLLIQPNARLATSPIYPYYVYAPRGVDPTMHIINGITDQLNTTINVTNDSYGIAISSDGKNVYLTNPFDHQVTVVDTTTNIVQSTISTGVRSDPWRIAITPDGKKAYVTNPKDFSLGFPQSDHLVSVIDTATNSISGTITVGDGPIGVTFANTNPKLPPEICKIKRWLCN